MCLAIPGKVLEIVDVERQIAKVEVVGVRRNVNIGLLTGEERPTPGDYVLIHVGFALSKIDEQEALETQRILEGLGAAYTDEVEQIKSSSFN
jgi:hydrogenase expression/formation protein HypC